MDKLFGTDGIRGKANEELSPHLALKMGRIVAHLLKQETNSDRPFILLGRDTRISGNMLEGALIAGINSAGVDVRLLGVTSTPAVAYLTGQSDAAGGVMVSASHNPVEDNGIKFFNAAGYKLPSVLEEKAEQLYRDNVSFEAPGGKNVGRACRAERLNQRYMEHLKKAAPRLDGTRIVLDCAHGSLYRIAPALYRELGAQVSSMFCTPTGLNINVNCGSTNPETLQKAVPEHKAHAGLAFDGDGDRLIAVDEKGSLLDGDAIMAVCGSHLKECGRLHGDTIVATVMSNGGLDLVGEEKGFRVRRTKVGDRYVQEEMLRGGYVLGGEQSGHIIFSEILPTGDGLLTSLQLLNVMAEKGLPLSRLASIIRRLPQKLVNCRVRDRRWEQYPRIRECLQQAENKLGRRGRVLLRASGTEPLVRIMVEGEDSHLLEQVSDELLTAVKAELGAPQEQKA